MSFDEKIEKLKKLVEQFRNNIKVYKSNNYDEANTRVDFIDKFFSLLDWDVSNEDDKSEAYRDVVREDKVEIEGKQKAPDYSFRIGGVRKYFVEAKKPAVNIKDDVDPSFQVRRYGWTAKLPLSILTDFEELAVFDTRIKPTQNDKSSVARIFYCNFEEYEKNFDFIYNTFSKKAIEKGSFDKYVEENKNKKGTTEIDKDFLDLIDNWRNELAKNIALRNSSINIYELNYAVQIIIDRLIFLRIAEDRNIEIYGTLQNISGQNEIYKSLTGIFKKADEKYNSNLFKLNDLIINLNVDDKILKSIIKTLYYPECPYEFSILGIEILGNIYEQFLGKTIRLTEGHLAKVEEKPEVRKAGGVYYTPQYIVNYIVLNTVGEMIKDKSPEEIEKIRIVDPACGSGSFLLGAYDYLLKYHINYWTDDKNIKKALKEEKIYKLHENHYKLTIEEKQKILTNNIYGVDIDSQAVEVTKLSLLLKLLEDENKESSGLLFKHSDLKLLPNLDKNIKCGNSLIGSDFYNDRDLSLFGNDEMRKVNVFDWEKEFPGIFTTKDTEDTKGGEKGGFDVVIGNPPYVNAIGLVELFQTEREYLTKSKEYETLYQKWDLYIPFIEKGIKLLKKNGLISMIIPYPFINQMYAKLLREYIIKECNLKLMVDLSDQKIFKDAVVTNCIFVVAKETPENKIKILKGNNASVEYMGEKTYKDLIFDEKTFVWDLKTNNKLNKDFSKYKTLGDYCFISIGMVLNADEKQAKGKFIKDDLISDIESDIHIKKYIEAKNISKYFVNKIRFLEWNTNRVPTLIRRPTFPELYEHPKILVTKIGELKATFDSNKLYCDQTIRILVLWKYLKGIQNNSINNSVKRYSNDNRINLEINSENSNYQFIGSLLIYGK